MMSEVNEAQAAVNRSAADELVRRVVEHVRSGKLSFREAAAYEVGRSKGIELDRLDKVEALARDAFLKAAGTERITAENGDWTCRVAEAAYGELEVASNAEALEAAINDERPVLFFYRSPVKPADRLHKNDIEHAGWRHVSPYEVRESARSGEEYVVGWDHDREAIRNYTVSKIEGHVVTDTQNDYRPEIRETGTLA
jgi:predicted DNA-binding transcriptional regulator YafY